MKDHEENQPTVELVDEMPVQTENLAFRAEEMIACGKCQRSNPPNRLNCFYCGAELDFSDEQSGQIKPVLRKLESWENGFNLIYRADQPIDPGIEKLTEISRMTRLDSEILRTIFASQTSLPLARAESEKSAAIVKTRLAESGVETIILSDEDLAVKHLPRRLRGLDFSENGLRLRMFNTDETLDIISDELVLIVTGAVFEKRVEATEQRNRKGENKLLKATETASDESLLDLYIRDDGVGFRIEQKGFDFSCLGAEKSLLAAENIEKLTRKLKEFAPEARLVEDYKNIRAALGNVWEIAERKDSKGLVRERFGKFNLGNVTTVSNLEQFTKYSRMLKNIL